MEIDNKVIALIEEHDFSINSYEDGAVELECYTPAGEDWIVNLSFDGTVNGFLEEIWEYYEDFDVDEAVEPLVECRGQRGVPSSIRTLVEDAEWKDSELKSLYDDALKLKLECGKPRCA